MPDKDDLDSVLFQVVKSVGELTGTQVALISQFTEFRLELKDVKDDLDKKHGENIKNITQTMNEHKLDDTRNFNKVFRFYHMILGGSFVIVAIWAVLKVIVPLFIK